MAVGATIRTTCLICGDVDLDVEDITLVPGSPTVYRFTHCGTITERPADLRVEVVLRACGVRELQAAPTHCSCGLAMFRLGALAACRNCDSPMPGLPPADKRGSRR